jgi:hypothetical protein
MSIILCRCDRLARGLPAFQGRDRDDRTKKMTIPSIPFYLLPSALYLLPSAFYPLPSTFSLLP